MAHEIEIRVYYEDTDAGGIVYYANYLKYAERARTELLRSIGFENKALMDHKNAMFVVRHIEADYLDAAQLDDILMVKTDVIEVKNASFTMKQTILVDDRPLFVMTVKLACVNTDKRPVRVPEDLKKALS